MINSFSKAFIDIEMRAEHLLLAGLHSARGASKTDNAGTGCLIGRCLEQICLDTDTLHLLYNQNS